MSILTKEVIQKILNDGWLLMDDCEGLENCTVIKELARMALAAIDSEPVGEFYEDGPLNWYQISDGDSVPDSRRIPLYRHAQPAPEMKPVGYLFVSDQGEIAYSPTNWGMHGFRLAGQIFGNIDVESQPEPLVSELSAPIALDDLLSMAASAIEDLLEHTDPNTSYYSGVWADVPGKLRAAAILQAGNSPVIPDGYVMVPVPDEFLSAEQNASGMFELSEDCMCRLAVALSQQSKGLVTPPGYVMVPKEPTDEMIAAAMNCDDVRFNSDESFCVQFGNIYEAMLAAAPTGIPMNSSAWIPVSERMPEPNKFVLVSNGVWVGQGLYDDSEHLESDEHWQDEHREFINVLHYPVTHWMPLPNPPKEVPDGQR